MAEAENDILPAEFVGMARLRDGVLEVGGVPLHFPRRWSEVAVYVRRSAQDLSIAEVLVAVHDGLAEEQLRTENEEAERYPLGAKEYWRSQSVGKSTYGPDAHPMTAEDFEEFWNEREGGT